MTAPKQAAPVTRTGTLPKRFDPKSLVGSYFHGGGTRSWQGQVVAEPSPGVYLVECYEWWAGQSNGQHLIELKTMGADSWRFYDTAEEMNEYYAAHPDMFRPADGE